MSELDPSTFLASPAKHVSRVCSFDDKALDGDGVILVRSPQGHNRAMLILVSGACDGSDVAEPADSDEADVRLRRVRTAPKVKLPSSLAPRVNRQAGRSLRDRSAVGRCEETPNAAEVGEKRASSQCAGTILGAPDDSGIDGSWKPKLSALRTIEQNALRRQKIGQALASKSSAEPLLQSCDEFGPKYAIAEHTRQIRLDHSRTACPAAHTHTNQHFLPLSPTPHTLRRQRTATQTALAPRRPHSQTPFASEGPRELERATESCSCDDAPVLAREWDALAATLEASPKVGLCSPQPLPHPPLPQNTAVCILRSRREGCGCDEEAPFLIVSPIGLGGSAVVARSLLLVRVPSSFFLRVLFCFEARHYLAVLFCAESRCRFLFWQCLALCVLPVLACT
ncbi:hypothetical protein BLNAU_23410 [Blattamonas nauphoetae]|uniref:Uncharacterized protein n=1 Tax=Blattamonas nauphoetae TaxID=2049346 RepID=A0ABQ9WTD6_9EUKA|nr:hypothetical protein BLNAU_23410 [Blattamonas nauphoetae]